MQALAISLCCVAPAMVFVAGSCFNMFIWHQSDYWSKPTKVTFKENKNVD